VSQGAARKLGPDEFGPNEAGSQPGAETALPRIGVAIVTYGAADFVGACLDSLLASAYPELSIQVVDNDSPDDTVPALRRWARARGIELTERRAGDGRPEHAAPPRAATVALIHSGENRGFAGGVNLGLKALLADPHCDLFWVLNPDTAVEPQAPYAFARRAREAGRFAIIGGRVLYLSDPERIHADAGRYRPWLGFPVSLNINRMAAQTEMPEESEIDYIPGMSMLVSRAFVERAGLMDESWFLYHEEIDWAFRRGDLPLLLEPDARVLHKAGASIGSGSGGKPASSLSVYFTYRNHLRFTARWAPHCLPSAYVAAWAMAFRRYRRAPAQLSAALRGLHRRRPPRAVAERLPAQVWSRLFEG
jgi:hypothetical protein